MQLGCSREENKISFEESDFLRLCWNENRNMCKLICINRHIDCTPCVACELTMMAMLVDIS